MNIRHATQIHKALLVGHRCETYHPYIEKESDMLFNPTQKKFSIFLLKGSTDMSEIWNGDSSYTGLTHYVTFF